MFTHKFALFTLRRVLGYLRTAAISILSVVPLLSHAALTLTINSLTNDEFSFSISGALDVDVAGDQRGWIAIKSAWSSNIGKNTEFIAVEPTVALNTITIGGTPAVPDVVYDPSVSWGDSVYFVNPNGGQFETIRAGTIVSGSMILKGVGAFNPAASLQLLSGFNNSVMDWVRLEAVATPSVIRFSFPLPGVSAETVLINAVLDHSGDLLRRNGSILAFTGELASCDFGLRVYDIKTGQSKVLTGPSRDLVCADLKAGKGVKGKIYEYMVEFGKPASFPPFDIWFSYDGHSGYDFKAAEFGSILAAEGGVLCVVTPVTFSGADIHRDPSKCPYASDPINGQLNRKSAWDAFHTFYIIHPSSENLTTWYLHATDLAPSVAQEIKTKGYANVSLGQEVATVGGCCISLGPHLHFEVRRGDSESIDPYGWNGTPRLWR